MHIYNPSILPLPPSRSYSKTTTTTTTTTAMRYLVAARQPQTPRTIDGQQFLFGEIVFCLMNRTFHCVTKPQLLSVNPDTLERYGLLEKKQRWGPWGNYVGMEDPRLFWGPKGEPQLAYGMNSQHADRLRSQWLMDVRVSLDASLREVILPIRTGEQVREPVELGATLGSKALSPIEKNWAPFLWEGGIAVHTLLAPRRTAYQLDAVAVEVAVAKETKTTAAKEPLRTKELRLRPIPLAADQDFARCYRQGKFQPSLQEGAFEAHHASNLLRLRWCHGRGGSGGGCSRGGATGTTSTSTGTGTGSANDDILFAVFHVKDTARQRYTLFVASWWARPGLPVRSIAGPFQLPSDIPDVDVDVPEGNDDDDRPPTTTDRPLPAIQFVTTIHFDDDDEQGRDLEKELEEEEEEEAAADARDPTAPPLLRPPPRAGNLDSSVLVSYGLGDIHGCAVWLRAHDFFQGEHLCSSED